ncbi:hypothetical protein [Pontibacter liquoris]|nr:hypothetical protein [Pontibacter liquoris]
MKLTSPLSLALVGTAFLIIGAAAYIYLTISYDETDAAIDLSEEVEGDYL